MSLISCGTGYFNAVGICLCSEVLPPSGPAAGWEMDVDDACAFVDAIGAFVEGADPRRSEALSRAIVLYVLGGEPFSRLDDLDRVLTVAERHRLTCEVATTAEWAVDAETVERALERLAGKLGAVQIFTTHAMMGRIGVAPVLRVLRGARAQRLSVVLRCGVGPGAPFPRELLALEEFNDDMTLLDALPLAPPPGEAPPDDGEGWLLESLPTRRRCAEVFTFLVAPNGDVYPCLRGLGETALRLGSLREEPVGEIMGRAMARPEMHKLRKEGPRHLHEAIQRSEARGSLHRGYLDPCHFHRHALHDAALARVVGRVEAGLAGPDRPR